MKPTVAVVPAIEDSGACRCACHGDAEDPGPHEPECRFFEDDFEGECDGRRPCLEVSPNGQAFCDLVAGHLGQHEAHARGGILAGCWPALLHRGPRKGELVDGTGWKDKFRAPEVLAARGPACERCKGDGVVREDVPGVVGHTKRVRCPECNGAGAARCNAEARTGHLCAKSPGHIGAGDVEHVSANGEAKWRDVPSAQMTGVVYVLQRFEDGVAVWKSATVAEVETAGEADHLCGVTSPRNPDGLPDFPAEIPDAKARYLVQCPRDGWIDVTRCYVDNIVLPWLVHPAEALAGSGAPGRVTVFRNPGGEGRDVRRALQALQRLTRGHHRPMHVVETMAWLKGQEVGGRDGEGVVGTAALRAALERLTSEEREELMRRFGR